MSEELTVYKTPLLTLDPNATAGGGVIEVVKYSEAKPIRDERDRLRHALEQVSFHLAQPGDDETPANQYVPTAAEIVTCQRIIEAALTPAGGGRNE